MNSTELPLSDQLRHAGLKLKGLGFLFAATLQGKHDLVAVNADEVSEGIGLILGDLGAELTAAASRAADAEE